jgi:hypothetical protein
MTDTNEAPFAPGAVVVLTSDGGKMTVVGCLPTADLPDADSYRTPWAIRVQWLQEDGTFHDRTFDSVLVKRYRSNWDRMQEGARLAMLPKDEHLPA